LTTLFHHAILATSERVGGSTRSDGHRLGGLNRLKGRRFNYSLPAGGRGVVSGVHGVGPRIVTAYPLCARRVFVVY